MTITVRIMNDTKIHNSKSTVTLKQQKMAGKKLTKKNTNYVELLNM